MDLTSQFEDFTAPRQAGYCTQQNTSTYTIHPLFLFNILQFHELCIFI